MKLEKENDYIHASYVDGYLQRKEFICTQGPLVATTEDFWLMVWQENCGAVVMLCQLLENGRPKCAAYWNPVAGRSFKAGEFVIDTLDQQSVDLGPHAIRVSTLQLSRRGCPKCRRIQHYAHLTWPDKGSPVEGYPCTQLIDLVRRKLAEPPTSTSTRQTPIVIHCSAGIGRTGTLVAIDICVQRLRTRRRVDVESVVRKIRQQRMQAVQTEEQYVYVHKALLQFLKNGDCGHMDLLLDRFLTEFARRYPLR